ncbi:hypothetical protein [Metamycoplasma buccale]|uniref:hypothetical protein n=1 Tax=Metamycoplasma buccale TaxID=55602 RepID=UPI00398EA72D
MALKVFRGIGNWIIMSLGYLLGIGLLTGAIFMAIYEEPVVTTYTKYVNDGKGNLRGIDYVKSELKKIDPRNANSEDSYFKPAVDTDKNFKKLNEGFQELLNEPAISESDKAKIRKYLQEANEIKTKIIDELIKPGGKYKVYESLTTLVDKTNEIINKIEPHIKNYPPQKFRNTYRAIWISLVSILSIALLFPTIFSAIYLTMYSKKMGIEVRRINYEKNLSKKILEIFNRYPEVKKQVDVDLQLANNSYQNLQD